MEYLLDTNELSIEDILHMKISKKYRIIFFSFKNYFSRKSNLEILDFLKAEHRQNFIPFFLFPFIFKILLSIIHSYSIENC